MSKKIYSERIQIFYYSNKITGTQYVLDPYDLELIEAPRTMPIWYLINEKHQLKTTYKDYALHLLNTSCFTIDHQGLLASRAKYMEWFDNINQEIKQSNLKSKMNIYEKHNVMAAAWDLFQITASIKMDRLKIDQVEYYEYNIIEQCYNGSLQKLNPKHIDTANDVITFDANSFYCHVLAKMDTLIPVKKGQLTKVNSIDFDEFGKTTVLGIFNVKIQSDNKELSYLLPMSEWYASPMLEVLYKYKDLLKLKIKINQSNEYNAIIWNKPTDKTKTAEKQVIPSRYLFEDWFNFMYGLKNKTDENNNKIHKDNIVMKTLFSGLWGKISQRMEQIDAYEDVSEVTDAKKRKKLDINTYKNNENYIITSEKDIYTSEKYFEGENEPDMDKQIPNIVYKVLNKKNCYKTELGRCKPFLVSKCYAYMLDIILSHDFIYKSFVRAHTDSITILASNEKAVNYFNNRILFKKEEKNSGYISFKNVNERYRYEMNDEEELIKRVIQLPKYTMDQELNQVIQVYDDDIEEDIPESEG